MVEVKSGHRWVFLLILLLLPALAKDYAYRSITLNVTVLEDSDLRVTEIYNVAFQGTFHEGFRSFYTDNIKDVRNFHVFISGHEIPAKRSMQGGEIEYTWPIDVTDQELSYTMTYTIVGLFKSKEKYDYLYYTAIPEMEKPIERFEGRFTFPQRVTVDQLKIRTLPPVSPVQAGPSTIGFRTSNFPASSHLDIEFEVPKGMVQIPFDWWAFFMILFNIFIIVLTVVIAIWSIIEYWTTWAAHGKDPNVQLNAKELLPNLRPAMAGVIVDESADIKEIIATVIDLAVRGYIFIREEKKTGLFGENGITLLKVRPNILDLTAYEQKVMNSLFASGNEVTVSSLENKFYNKIPGIVSSMHDEAFRLGLFPENVEKTTQEYSGKFMLKPAILVIVGGIMLFLQQVAGFFSFCMGFVLILAGGIAAAAMPAKTVYGKKLSNKYVELKDWMIKYPLKEERLFDEFLPYAIAFGNLDKWMSKMEALSRGREIRRSWYSGTLSTRSMGRLYSSMNRTMVSSPSSSGHGSFGSGHGGGGGHAGFR